MQAILRVEVVVQKFQLPKVIRILDNEELESYTIIRDVYGKGERGMQDGEGLTEAFVNSMLILGCTKEKFDRIKEPLRKLLKRVGGICMVTEAEWLIH